MYINNNNKRKYETTLTALESNNATVGFGYMERMCVYLLGILRKVGLLVGYEMYGGGSEYLIRLFIYCYH